MAAPILTTSTSPRAMSRYSVLRLMPVNLQASGTRMLIGSIDNGEDDGKGVPGIEAPIWLTTRWLEGATAPSSRQRQLSPRGALSATRHFRARLSVCTIAEAASIKPRVGRRTRFGPRLPGLLYHALACRRVATCPEKGGVTLAREGPILAPRFAAFVRHCRVRREADEHPRNAAENCHFA